MKLETSQLPSNFHKKVKCKGEKNSKLHFLQILPKFPKRRRPVAYFILFFTCHSRECPRFPFRNKYPLIRHHVFLQVERDHCNSPIKPPLKQHRLFSRNAKSDT